MRAGQSEADATRVPAIYWLKDDTPLWTNARVWQRIIVYGLEHCFQALIVRRRGFQHLDMGVEVEHIGLDELWMLGICILNAHSEDRMRGNALLQKLDEIVEL
jgi:hypothetical protein